MVTVVPVIKLDSSDARNAAAEATSDGWPMRLRIRGSVISWQSSSSAFPTLAACFTDPLVSIGPGQSAFTLHADH